ncbi:MAG: XrtA system polysaccharide chain length determinant [Vicinamibacterales bacterium]
MLPGKKYTPETLLAVALRYRHALVACTLLGAIGGCAVALWLPNKYMSETLILVVPQRVPEAYVRSTVTTPIEDRLRSLTQQIMSRTRLERIVEDFNLYASERGKRPMEDIVEMMRGRIAVRATKSDSFILSYTSDDPQIAMKVTQRLATLFIDENLQDRTMMAEGTNQFLQSQLEEARARLIEHEKKLESFRRRYSGQLPEQMQSNLQVMQNSQMQVTQIQESVNRDRDRKLVLERQISELQSQSHRVTERPASAPTDGSGVGATPSAQLALAQEQLRLLELRLKPEHPDIVRQRRLIQELEAKVAAEALTQPLTAAGAGEAVADPDLARQIGELKAELLNVDRQIAAKQAEETRIKDTIANYQSRVESVPGLQSELTELMRDYDTLQDQYKGLLRKNEESRIAANLERRSGGEQFRILDPARVPERPFSPNRSFIALCGLLAGLGLAIGLAGSLEFRDRSLRSDQDVMMVLALPVLASIPIITTNAERRRRRQLRLTVSATAATLLVVGGLVAWKLLPWHRVFERLK